MAEGDTLVNALIGGIAGFVLGWVPFSPVLGGAIAGYLQGGSRGAGIRVGAYSGLVTAVPGFLLGVVAFLFFSTVAIAAPAGDPGVGFGIVGILLLVLVGLAIGGLYTIGLGALGGWLGNYVKYDTDLLE